MRVLFIAAFAFAVWFAFAGLLLNDAQSRCAEHFSVSTCIYTIR